MKKYYDTLSLAVEDLQKQGYTEDLNLKRDCLECRALDYKILADEFEVDSMYRFEGDSNPDDSSILFAISSDSYKIKGLLIDAYGAYSDPLTTDMIEKLRYRP
ncbi:phosphoribosylpyrophosphate synthetase [uncultured Croceitalea sp.]|uniref:phosphoribosylpyrophosphate synthetase n=1 Tax=uncultured Croceitalea sp. TaxID=1798908 RepID=UPI003305D249